MKHFFKYYFLLALPMIAHFATKMGEIDWWEIGI